MQEIHQNKNDKRRGLVGTFSFHAVLILLALLPFLKYPVPPPGQQGILVSLGFPDQGAGDDRPDTQNEIEQDPVPESQPEEAVVEESEEATETILEIYDSSEQLVGSIPLPIGTTSFEWDGLIPGSAKATEGVFVFRAVHFDGDEELSSSQAQVFTEVTEVRLDEEGTVLVLANNTQHSLADIKRFR